MHSQEHLIFSASVDASASGMACTVPATVSVAEPKKRAEPGLAGGAAGFDGPRQVIWELARECEVGVAGHRRSAGEDLTTAESLSLIDELAGCGVKALVFAGEPLARPDWRALVERAVERGLDVELETGGPRITEDAAAELTALGITGVVVNIDSHLAEEHDALRRAPGLHDRAVAAVRLLVAHGVPVVVGFTATRRNWWDAAEVAVLACALRAPRVRFVEYVAGDGDAELALRPDELSAALTTWRDLAHKYRGHMAVSWWSTRTPGFQPDAGDESFMLTPRIRPDGTLTPDVFSTTPLGTFRRRSLRDIWTRSPLVAWLQSKRRQSAAAGAGASVKRCRGMVE